MDVIKSDYAGLKQVVASMGTQLSQEHVTFLKKLTHNITLMFDGDFAGKEATLKTGQTLLQQGLNVYVVQLPSEWIQMNILENMVMTHFKFCSKDKNHSFYLKFKHIKMKSIIMT